MTLFGTPRVLAIGLVVAAGLGLAACGGDDDGGGGSSATGSGGTASAGGVAAQSIDGTDVLVDSDGHALYSADQETGDKVLCTRSCTSIWDPVPAPKGADAPSELDLGEVERPDGGKQLTYEGAPLYTFTEEGSGELTGDGVTDSFDGERITWHAATTSAGAGSSSADEESSDSSGGAGGYGY
ncbi:MAG: COG4315 family predicted lipoprotein [Solirubrobacterales bacterium]